MAKINWALVILLIGAAIQLFVGWNYNSVATGIIAIGIILGILTVLKITINGVNTSGKGAITLMTLILGIMLIFGLSAAGLVKKDTLPTASLSTTETNIQTQLGQTGSAVLPLTVKNQTGAAYAGSGTIYALNADTVAATGIKDRNDLMKLLYDGKTSNLDPNSMTLASGRFTFSDFNAKIGDTVMFAGYRDTSPGASENISFIKTATITGISAGSNPEWMLSDAKYVWYNYAAIRFYDSSDTARTQYTEDEDAAIEKTFTLYAFPDNNGDVWKDAALWVESPEANIAAIKKIKITPSEGSAVEYGMPYELSSTEVAFRAMPALGNATNKMYYAGAFPEIVRTSATQKAKMTIEVTYDHPATNFVMMNFNVTQNTNALTTSGGHFDSPSNGFKLNLSSAQTDAWT